MSRIYWKASSIDNLTDARFFNALENAWIEFVFDVLEPRSVTIEKAKSIIEWLYEPNILASFGMHQTPEEILFILQECSMQYAAIPFGHELIYDEDFTPLAFIKISNKDISSAIELEHPPFAFIIRMENEISATEQLQIEKLLKYSKVFLQISSEIETIKNQIAGFSEIGIEIPTQPEQSPGWSAVDFYDQMIEALES